MKTYLVNIPVVESDECDIYLAGEIRADSWAEAEFIAEREGYELLGPLVDTIECSDEVEAMIEKQGHTLQ